MIDRNIVIHEAFSLHSRPQFLKRFMQDTITFANFIKVLEATNDEVRLKKLSK